VHEEQDAEISNGGGGGEKELVNSNNPHYPFLYFLVRDRGLRRGEKSGNGSPLTGRVKQNYRATHKTVRAQSE
jgi:hypothetical protein